MDEYDDLLEIKSMLNGLLRQVYQLHLDINHPGTKIGDPGEPEILERWMAVYHEARLANLDREERRQNSRYSDENGSEPAQNVFPISWYPEDEI